MWVSVKIGIGTLKLGAVSFWFPLNQPKQMAVCVFRNVQQKGSLHGRRGTLEPECKLGGRRTIPWQARHFGAWRADFVAGAAH